MLPKFDERKATQLAGMLLKLRDQNGRMSYMKLLKLMYLIDREALIRWGWSLIGDRYASMPFGCVLSGVYNLIGGETLGSDYWRSFISEPSADKEVKLLREPEFDELSRAEKDLVEEIFAEFGRRDRWDLAKYTHSLPEYQTTEYSSIPIDYRDVLEKAANKSRKESDELLDELHALALMERLAK